MVKTSQARVLAGEEACDEEGKSKGCSMSGVDKRVHLLYPLP